MTEEIEKAVSDYSKSLETIAFENLKGEEMPYLLRGAFKEGLELTNKHWQEKTRWIPVEERLPEARETPYYIVIKYKEAESDSDNIGAICIYDKTDVDYILLEQITHWKEIE